MRRRRQWPDRPGQPVIIIWKEKTCCISWKSTLTATRFLTETQEKLSFYVKCLKTGIYGAFSQFFLDAQKLVVLGDTFAPAGCACLDLAGIERHGKIGDSGILCLSGAVGGHGGVSGL